MANKIDSATMASNNNSISITNNNRQFIREQLIALAATTTASSNSSNNNNASSVAATSCCFEYAVQPDGSSFQETQWRALRRRSHACFVPFVQQQQHPTTAAAASGGCSSSRISLAALDQQVRQNASRHFLEKQQNLPPLPQPASSSYTSAAPAPSRQAVASSSSFMNSAYNSSSTFTANSSSTHQAQPPNIGPAVNEASSQLPSADGHGDDEYDALIASIDVDQLISQHSNNSSNSNPAAAAGTRNAATAANASYNCYPTTRPSLPPQRNSNNTDRSSFDLYSNDFGMMDFEEPSSTAARVSSLSANDSSASYNNNSNNRSDSGTSSSSAAAYGGVGNSATNHTSFGGGNSYSASSSYHNNNNIYEVNNSNSFSSNHQSKNDSYSSSYSSGNNNYNASSSSISSSSAFAPAAVNGGGDCGDAPLLCCPGHNLPCISLTARSEANNGRQFYKCSVQDDDQNCKFFQWADGLEGNWNNTNNNNDGGSGAPSYGPGDVKDALSESRHKFGHRSFRPGQKEVIENAIAGRDVFVLMPTGGGKSLCYQLPAWCCPGLTVVISPLLSLIQDQVQSMTKLGVESVFLASSQDYQTEQMDITRRLNETTVHGGVKLLYLTPEKLNNSQMMQSLLRRLHSKKLLSRLVVDEAHCLSDWGHDFRPDYNKLGMLRREYPGVPLMALTATANEKVVGDAIRALDMRNEYRYTSSFNRPNLRYEVRRKDTKTIDAIAEYISKRPSESGVIYCLSRKDCEKLAEKLQEHVRSKSGCNRVRVSFYHADLDPHERQRRHSEWSNGIISVLCATIAFGMGIDKPDVRYVIHYSMPKSITHYYQESGRAGRDGDNADCILYYSYKDKKILENMIVKSSNNPSGQATRRKIDQLYSCVGYCEDEFACRRTLQLDFFGEKFDRSKCNKTCDNCRAQREPDRRDLTSVAQTILRLFTDATQQKRGTRLTLVQLIDLFRGSKSQSATKFLDTGRLQGYGAGSKYKKHEVDRMAHSMVFDRIIVEKSVENKSGFNSDYVEFAENAMAVQNGSRKFFVDFPKPAKRADVEKENKAAEPKSTRSRKQDSTGKKKKAPAPAAKANAKKAALNMIQKPLTFTIDESSGDEEDDDELDVAVRPRSTAGKSQSVSILPHEATQVLISRIKTLATNWAEEERMYGKNMFYWNILSNDAMKSIAAQAPTTIEDLEGIGVLGENIIKEYGERIVKIVASYVAQEGLEEYVALRPAKRAKTGIGSSSGPAVVEVVDDDGDDEFGTDIDFSAIDLPDAKPAAKSKKPTKVSRYFDS